LTIVYKVCKDARAPFKIDEMASIMCIDAKKIRGYYVDIMRSSTEKKKSASPVDFIPRFASKLKLGGKTESAARQMVRDVMEHDTNGSIAMGKQVSGYSAAALYLAAIMNGEQPFRNRETISRYTKIAESTIKKRAEEIVSILGININEEFSRNYKKFLERHKNRFKNG
jgi:transcription initiation factor TFIIB